MMSSTNFKPRKMTYRTKLQAGAALDICLCIKVNNTRTSASDKHKKNTIISIVWTIYHRQELNTTISNNSNKQNTTTHADLTAKQLQRVIILQEDVIGSHIRVIFHYINSRYPTEMQFRFNFINWTTKVNRQLSSLERNVQMQHNF